MGKGDAALRDAWKNRSRLSPAGWGQEVRAAGSTAPLPSARVCCSDRGACSSLSHHNPSNCQSEVQPVAGHVPGSRPCPPELPRVCSLGLLALLLLADLSCLPGRREPLPAFASLAQASLSQVLKRDLAWVQLCRAAARMCCSPSPLEDCGGGAWSLPEPPGPGSACCCVPNTIPSLFSQQLNVLGWVFKSSRPG